MIGFLKEAQVIPLTINEIAELRTFHSDIPGQEYLLQGPGIAELRNLRNLNNPEILARVEDYMHKIFEIIEDHLREDVDREYDEQEIENEIDESLYYQVDDYRFRNDEWEAFLDYIQSSTDSSGRTELQNLLVISWHEQYGRKLPDRDTFRQIFNKVKKYRQDFNRAGLPITGTLSGLGRTYLQAVADEATYDTEENFWYALAEQTADMIEKTLYEHQKYSHQRLPVPGLPDWIDQKVMQDEASERDFKDNLEEWYKQYHHADLRNQALESLGERDWEHLRETQRNIEHRYGYDPFKMLMKRRWQADYNSREWPRSRDVEYDREDIDDERRDIPLGELCLILNELKSELGWSAPTVRKSADLATMYMQAIKDLLQSDRMMRRIFANDINKLDIEPQALMDGISSAVEDNVKAGDWDYLPIPVEFANQDWVLNLRTQVEQRIQREKEEKERQEREREAREAEEQAAIEAARPPPPTPEQIAAEQERQRQLEEEWRKRYEKEQAELEKYHRMLQHGKGHMGPEELQRMKELGIARHPFPHDYALNRGSYPGHGYAKMPSGLEPFTLSIAPTEDVVSPHGTEKIPARLLHDMGLHNVPQPDRVSALGWVGGYGDYRKKVLYITEVQSDIMQRSGYMRDPEKLRQERQTEILRLQGEISNLEQTLQQPVQTKSPRERLTQTIQNIQNEQAKLDPASPKFQKNQQLLQNLQQQLSRIPEQTKSDPTQQKKLRLRELKKQLRQQEQLLGKQPPAADVLYQSRGKNPPQYWHDYKSKVEQTFSDWVAVFFNAILREAKTRGFRKVRIITADELMKMWANFGGPEKRKLFVRVYNRTAHSYNARNMSAIGRRWFQIDLRKPGLRIARHNMERQNWFGRIFKQATFQPAQWKQHIDTFFDHMRRSNFDLETIFDMWLGQVPEILKQNGELRPQFAQQVKEHLIEKYGFDPFGNEAHETAEIPNDPRLILLDRLLDEYKFFNVAPNTLINHWLARLSPEDRQDRRLLDSARRLMVEKHDVDPLETEGEEPIFSSLPPMLTLHLDMFFEQMLRDSPELRGPEFETAGEFETNEGKREIFQRWLAQLNPRMKQGEDIRPEYKRPLREYLIARWKFDPYEGEDQADQIDDVRIPTPEELEQDWNQ